MWLTWENSLWDTSQNIYMYSADTKSRWHYISFTLLVSCGDGEELPVVSTAFYATGPTQQEAQLPCWSACPLVRFMSNDHLAELSRVWSWFCKRTQNDPNLTPRTLEIKDTHIQSLHLTSRLNFVLVCSVRQFLTGKPVFKKARNDPILTLACWR